MQTPPSDFRDETVLVTGAAGGIGRAAVMAWAHAGASLAVADLDGAKAEEVAAAARALGVQAIAIAADVASNPQVEAMVAAVVARFGRLDCAFNNAGIELEASPISEADEAVFDRVVAVNLKGVFLCLKHETRQMLRQGGGGAIVNTASVAGLIGAAGMPAYAASKHGVVGLTKSAALDHALQGIRVNAICPGVVRTPMMDRALALHPEREGRLARAHPMGRIAEPEEVAAAALWLCGGASGFITGQALAIDGGMVAR